MTPKKKFLLVLVIILASASLTPHLRLHAQEEREGIGVSPTTMTLEADPGQELTGQFNVVNAGNTTFKYRVYASDLSVKNEEYEKDFERSDTAVSPSTWFSLQSDIRELRPDSQATINYGLNIPADTLSRGYSAVIFAETAAEEPDATGVARLKRVGMLVYLKVRGALVEKGSVASFTVKKWQHRPPIKVELRLENEGNVHLSAVSTTSLTNVFGKKVAQTTVESTLLPETIRKVSHELSPKRALGLYKLGGSVELGSETIDLQSQWIVVVPPMWLIILSAVLAILLILWSFRRRRARGRTRR